MDVIAIWFIVLGLLLLFISLSNSWLQRVPLTTSLIYLVIGVLLGPTGSGLLKIDMLKDAKLLEHLSEIAVIVSLFNAGLKLRLPLKDQLWRLPVGLAFISMTIGVGLVALIAKEFLGMNWAAAILLAAVLSPTDPVLASEVQVKHPNDHDKLRFTLTCEAGFNDGTAFPFVMLSLGLMGLYSSGSDLQSWILKDVLWAVTGGLGIGFTVGLALGWLEKRFRHLVKKAKIMNDFLALALISLSYGIAIACHTYGFLAVFAAGITMRQLETRQSKWNLNHPFQKISDEVLFFNEQFESLLEVAVVILLGSMLRLEQFTVATAVIGLSLMFLVRPLSVFLVGLPMRESKKQLGLMSWFGIRGIGSVYYLAYAITHGIPEELATQIIGITFSLVAISTVIHGLTVTPLMKKFIDA